MTPRIYSRPIGIPHLCLKRTNSILQLVCGRASLRYVIIDVLSFVDIGSLRSECVLVFLMQIYPLYQSKSSTLSEATSIQRKASSVKHKMIA